VELGALACPKCGANRNDAALACRRCGLAVERMAAFEREREAVPEKLVAAWDRALGAWSEPGMHDELLQLAHSLDAYPWLAAKYRTRVDDPVSDAQLGRIRKAMEVTLLASATPRPDKASAKYRGLIVIVALVALASVLLYLVIRARDTTPDPQQPIIEQK
jgi:ribosomal protein L40E